MAPDNPLTIEAVCRCGARLTMGASAAGKAVPCIACGEKVQMPARDGTPIAPEKPGFTDEQQARYRAAIDALKDRPRDPGLVIAAARAAESMSNRNEAFLYYERAYGLDPSHTSLLSSLRANASTPEQIAKVQKWSARPASFLQSFGDGLYYPFRGPGLGILVVGWLFFFAFQLMFKFGGGIAIGGVGSIVAVYMIVFYISVLNSTAIGDEDLPHWPDFTDPVGLSVDANKFGMAHIIAFLPIILPLLLGVALALGGSSFDLVVDDHGDARGGAVLAMVLYGIFFGIAGMIYLPMAILANCVFGFSFACANPFFVARSIWATRKDYTVLVLLYFVIGTAAWIFHGIANLNVLTFFAFGLPASLAVLYGTVVQMRLLGMFFRYNQARLGWLADRP